MAKDFDSRIRRLEKKRGRGKMAIDPIEELIAQYDEEQILCILIGTKRPNDEEREELRKVARWMKEADGEAEIPSELLEILQKIHGLDFTETCP
jgi:hypothetical protein